MPRLEDDNKYEKITKLLKELPKIDAPSNHGQVLPAIQFHENHEHLVVKGNLSHIFPTRRLKTRAEMSPDEISIPAS